MRTVVIISHILLLTGLVVIRAGLTFAQEYKPYNTFNKEAELQKFVEHGGKVEEISPDVYKLTYRTGESRVFNFNLKDNFAADNNPVDTTIINMWEIDTTKYSNKFIFWQRVELNNDYVFTPPFVDDLNRNGRPEIYGKHHSSFLGINGGPVEVYERNHNGSFVPLYVYSDSATLSVKAMGEIHGSGEKEIFMNYYNDTIPQYVIYRSDSISVLPTTFDFIFYYTIPFFSIYDMILDDFDKNGISDCAFISADENGFPIIIISVFRDSINNFSTVFEYENLDETFSGFAIGDFDQDRKTELIAGGGLGKLISIETMRENSYELIWEDNFSTYNAYMKTKTADIDGNGKPEFWIGGQDFPNGITRLECYEANGDNSYEPVAIIELRYINSLSTFYLQAKDLDGDGKEEIIISIANVILILKFTGSHNNHHYEIYYVKIGEASEPTAEFLPLTNADLDGDGKVDILLPFQKSEYGQAVNFSYILKQNGTVNVEPLNTLPTSLDVYVKSYPVPFNSMSSVKFSLAKEGIAKIKVYDSLGKERITLIEEKLSPGEYNIHWEAQDKYGNPLPSGIYFISLQTDNVFKTIKTILLK
ncbi:MAG: T9SS type A sorting domain-containing protein [Ignavibacterium album]|uniref:T9SS type A sorting domain-containing protein n=1 Tax=Ignavibacterium album TaxID=591197 RepID=UPI0026EA752D|nr:T9SS type A sorting domain-containing protein [Ignavibacterium album]MCX8104268.1 T9SS type A sorting domain-containing protein [Ignavibacterium album]